MEPCSLQFDVPVINKTHLHKVAEKLRLKEANLRHDVERSFQDGIHNFIIHLKGVRDDMNNAEVLMVDSLNNTVIIVAGSGHNRYQVTISQQGDVEILYIHPTRASGAEHCLQFDVPEINEANLYKAMKQFRQKDANLGHETEKSLKVLTQTFAKQLKKITDDMKNAEVTMVDGHNNVVRFRAGSGQSRFHVALKKNGDVDIQQGVSPDEKTRNKPSAADRQEPTSECLRRNIDIDDARTEYISEMISLPVINKTKLGKAMVQICGNEGSTDTPVQAVFRKLFQTLIDYLEREKESVWTQAEVTLYDSYGNTVVLQAGKPNHKFVVQVDGKDEILVTATKRPGLFTPIKTFFKEEHRRSMPKRAIEGANGPPAVGQWTVTHNN